MEKSEKSDLRFEGRTKGRKNASVEFVPGKNEMAHQFKLKDFSSKGLGIMVRNDSKVLKYIKPGDIMEMKYYPDEEQASPVLHRTQIKHISKPEPGKHQGHMLVGLLIL